MELDNEFTKSNIYAGISFPNLALGPNSKGFGVELHLKNKKKNV